MLGVVFHYTHTPQAAGPRGLPPQLTSHRGACSGFLGWKGRRWAEGMSFRTGMNSPSGIFHPLFTGCPRLSLSPSSLSSHQGHPRPAHGGPCAPLSHPMAHIFPRSCIPVPSPRCIPDVLCASHHLFSTSSSSFPCQELWVASVPPDTTTMTSLSLRYRARPPSVLQCHCWHPLLPPQIYHSSFPSVAESKSPGTSIVHAFILSPSEAVHALRAFFHPLHSCFHHRALVNISVFLFCFTSLLSFCLGRRSLKVLTF